MRAFDVVDDGAGAVAREQDDEIVGVAGVGLDVDLMRGDVDEVACVRLDDIAQAFAAVEARAALEDVDAGLALAVVVDLGAAAGRGA